jgi:hypothetical protein
MKKRRAIPEAYRLHQTRFLLVLVYGSQAVKSAAKSRVPAIMSIDVAQFGEPELPELSKLILSVDVPEPMLLRTVPEWLKLGAAPPWL